jgi:hypothetical protein
MVKGGRYERGVCRGSLFFSAAKGVGKRGLSGRVSTTAGANRETKEREEERGRGGEE